MVYDINIFNCRQLTECNETNVQIIHLIIEPRHSIQHKTNTSIDLSMIKIEIFSEQAF